jgi:hypothetical protein
MMSHIAMNRKKVCRALALALTLTALVSCTNMALRSPSQTFALTKTEADVLKHKARQGDGAAALRLYQYYAIYLGEPQSGLHWKRVAIQKKTLRSL